MRLMFLSVAIALSAALTPLDVALGQEFDTEAAASQQLLDPLNGMPADEYGNCPDPAFVCAYFHANAELSAYCGYAQCFKKNDFEAAVVQAVDDEGLFPRTFKSRDMDGQAYNEWAGEPCILKEKRNNAATWIIPEPNIRCGAGMLTPDAVYYWHFGSNPASGCLGIVECKETISYAPVVEVPAP